ncbi:SpdA protein, partial [Streptomyces sp. WAC05292]
PEATPPEPAPPTVALPAPPAAAVPPALLDHARKIAEAHRVQTGSPIDAATLRARLGVPAALADSIALQLA